MSIGGKSESQKSQSQQTSNPVINTQGLDMLNANVGRADQIANLPFQPYTGTMVAPLSANENLAIGAAPGAFAAGQPAYTGAQNTGFSLSGYQAPQISAATAGPTAINRGDIRNVSGGDLLDGITKYQSPYTNDVVNATLSDLERSRELQRRSDQQSTPNGAFGGSRQGVADAQTNEAYQRTAAQTAAQLRQQGFDTASSLAQGDAARALQAAQGNQNADLSVAGQNAGFNFGNNQFNANAINNANQFNANTDIAGAGVRQTAANSLAALGGQEQNSFINALQAALQTGGVQTANAQSQADAAYQEFLRMLNDPFQKQQLRNQSLGLVPVGLGQSSQGTSNGSASSFGFNFGLK